MRPSHRSCVGTSPLPLVAAGTGAALGCVGTRCANAHGDGHTNHHGQGLASNPHLGAPEEPLRPTPSVVCCTSTRCCRNQRNLWFLSPKMGSPEPCPCSPSCTGGQCCPHSLPRGICCIVRDPTRACAVWGGVVVGCACFVTFCTSGSNPYLLCVCGHHHSKASPAGTAVPPWSPPSPRAARRAQGLSGMSTDRHSGASPRAATRPTCPASSTHFSAGTGFHPHPGEPPPGRNQQDYPSESPPGRAEGLGAAPPPQGIRWLSCRR